ncbi:hypothetical protein [Maritalea porphyrae]|uniref:hypothetical protein n=1 Tax=Maritalea porphyrae TaxID=880732 RepID=UPI0024E0DBF1|nr:hypothetical protein [Maritalea porphyrae]
MPKLLNIIADDYGDKPAGAKMVRFLANPKPIIHLNELCSTLVPRDGGCVASEFVLRTL